VRLEDEVADAVVCSVVSNGPQQCEAATLPVDGVLARREGDVASTSAPLPDGEADQLQAFELAVAEVQLGVRQLAGGLLFLVGKNLDGHVEPPESPRARGRLT